MGNHDTGQVHPLLQFHDFAQNLSLRYHVQRGGRLVHNQQIGVEHQAQHNGQPLHHSAGQLVRIERIYPFRQVYQIKQFQGALTNLSFGCMGFVHAIDILKLAADAVHRAEAVHGLLKHDGNAPPQELFEGILRHGKQVLPVKFDAARYASKPGIELPQHGHDDGRLARSALADDTQRIATLNAEGNPVHCFEIFLARAIANTQVLRFQQQLVSLPHSFFILGLSA